jgi:hypothetical protein
MYVLRTTQGRRTLCSEQTFPTPRARRHSPRKLFGFLSPDFPTKILRTYCRETPFALTDSTSRFYKKLPIGWGQPWQRLSRPSAWRSIQITQSKRGTPSSTPHKGVPPSAPPTITSATILVIYAPLSTSSQEPSSPTFARHRPRVTSWRSPTTSTRTSRKNSTSAWCSTTTPPTKPRRSKGGVCVIVASISHSPPSYGAWMNFVERGFSALDTNKFQRSAHRTVKALAGRHQRVDGYFGQELEALGLAQELARSSSA